MNNTNTTETTEETSMMSMFWAFVDYALNKYMPLVIISFICFYSFGFETWEPYIILGLLIFSNKYNFNCGYASCCVENEIDEDN